MKIIKLSQGGKPQGGGYFKVYIEYTFEDGTIERYENTVLGKAIAETPEGRPLLVVSKGNNYLMNEWGDYPAFELPEDPGHQAQYELMKSDKWEKVNVD
jgi:hypothetical protein